MEFLSTRWGGPGTIQKIKNSKRGLVLSMSLKDIIHFDKTVHESHRNVWQSTHFQSLLLAQDAIQGVLLCSQLLEGTTQYLQ